MKIYLFTLTILFGINSNAQEFKNYGTPLNIGDKNYTAPFFNSLIQRSEYKQGNVNEKKVDGSPYTNELFTPSEIVGIPYNFNMRYNAYADEVEVEKAKGEVYALKKDNEFKTILIDQGRYKLQLVNYWISSKKEVYGYLVELIAINGTGLYRRDKMNLIAGKEAITSFDIAIPPKLVRSKDRFYLKQKENNIIEFPENKKQLIQLFPSFQKEISNFINEKDIDFKSEKDLIQLTEFISTL
jgi:hypothetical protein